MEMKRRGAEKNVSVRTHKQQRRLRRLLSLYIFSSYCKTRCRFILLDRREAKGKERDTRERGERAREEIDDGQRLLQNVVIFSLFIVSRLCEKLL
jgi:hypothetical protein